MEGAKVCSQQIAIFHSQGILESCYPKVQWNLRGSVWELPLKADASTGESDGG